MEERIMLDEKILWNGTMNYYFTKGYNKAIDDVIYEIVNTKSEVAEKEHFDAHLFTVLAQRQNEIIDLIKKLKDVDKK